MAVMFNKKDEQITPPDRLMERVRRIAANRSLEDNTVNSRRGGQPRAERKPAFKAATLTTIGGERIEVVVKDLNAAGARIEFLRDLHLADRVLFSEHTVPIRTWAYVIWQRRGAAGLEFVKT